MSFKKGMDASKSLSRGDSSSARSRSSQGAHTSGFLARDSPAASPESAPEHFDDANLYEGEDDTVEGNFKVVIRVRPPVPRELQGYRPYVDVAQVTGSDALTLCDALDMEDGRPAICSRQNFVFDHVYGGSATQAEVYQCSARPAVLSVLEGYNATLMAYGQTGTGKTYTMEGFTSQAERGIIPRAIEDIFSYIAQARDTPLRFLVRASYMQIYNEIISDLLEPPQNAKSGLVVRHTPHRGVYVDGLSEWIVRTPDDVYQLIEQGTSLRATSSTRMSELSSRSHAIFTVVVEVMEGAEQECVSYHFGKLNIVDLAGSEKVRQSGVSGQRLEETKKINKSLHELGNVISALSAKAVGKMRHIPFRNSVLTSALRDSLGGNCKTTLFACISPALESYTESLSTLMFASRAKQIRNHATINEDMDQAMLLRKYEKELQKLRHQLAQQKGAGPLLDPTLLTELEEDRRRAEQGREEALEALQRTSAAREQEQLARQTLEVRIRELENLMNKGGMVGSPQTREAYERRLEELDRERQALEEDKEQVGRYKQLLLKQRDIMLNLTRRLNERDETILELQEEIDAYDAHVEMLENKLLSVGGGGGSNNNHNNSNGKDRSPDTFQIVSEPITEYTSGTPSPRSGAASPTVRSKALGSFSRAQAEEFVRSAKVVETASGGGSPRYRSALKPSDLLTAEEKMQEMLMLGGSAGGLAVGQDKESQRLLHQAQEELQRRAAEVARQSYAAAAAETARQLDALALRALAAEDRCRLLELGAQLADTAPAEARRLLREEVARVDQAYARRAEQLLDGILREKKERRQLAREVDRLRFEVERALERVGTAPAHKAEVSRLWQALQEVEEEVLASLPAAPVAATTTPQSAAALLQQRDNAWQLKVREQELLVRQLQTQRHTAAPVAAAPSPPPPPKQDSAVSAAAQEALHDKVTALEKDRAAIRTILEQRVKVKLEHIAQLMQGDASNPALAHMSEEERHRKMVFDLRNLQNLVNASIRAMDNEH